MLRCVAKRFILCKTLPLWAVMLRVQQGSPHGMFQWDFSAPWTPWVSQLGHLPHLKVPIAWSNLKLAWPSLYNKLWFRCILNYIFSFVWFENRWGRTSVFYEFSAESSLPKGFHQKWITLCPWKSLNKCVKKCSIILASTPLWLLQCLVWIVQDVQHFLCLIGLTFKYYLKHECDIICNQQIKAYEPKDNILLDDCYI